MTRTKNHPGRITRHLGGPRCPEVRDRIAAWREPKTLTGTPAYLVGLDHQLQELDTLLRARVLDLLRPDVLALQTLSGQLASMPAPPPSPATVNFDEVRPGEMHLPPALVRSRRIREQEDADRTHQHRLDAHEQLRKDLELQIAHHNAVIEEAWALAVATSVQLTHRYQHRAATYCRVLHRRGVPLAVPVLTQPTWTTLPCPWTTLPTPASAMHLTAMELTA